jgi:hypothetical protein
LISINESIWNGVFKYRKKRINEETRREANHAAIRMRELMDRLNSNPSAVVRLRNGDAYA